MSNAERVIKVFKNVHKLTFEELIVYLQSTKLAGIELEIGCFLCNYKDRSICTGGRGCSKSYICDLLNEELEKLDNLSTATEIEAALKPVYLYHEELERIKRKQKVLVVEKPEIVVHGTKEKPYFEIRYKEVGKDKYNIGFSSYYLNFVFDWLDEEFEIVKVQNENEEEKKVEVGMQEKLQEQKSDEITLILKSESLSECFGKYDEENVVECGCCKLKHECKVREEMCRREENR